jgi:hypothetical protein
MPPLFRDVATGTAPNGVMAGLWARRAVVALYAAVAGLALLDVFGQQPQGRAATAPGATLRLSAPGTVRGGLFFQSRLDVRATRTIEHPRLVLDRGWFEGMQINSIEPNPTAESSRHGRVVLSYDTLQAGDTLTVWLQFEVDPTYSGHRSYGVELDDATAPLAAIDHDLRVLP